MSERNENETIETDAIIRLFSWMFMRLKLENMLDCKSEQLQNIL